MSRLPSDVLRTMYFDTVLLTASALGYLVDVVGAARVVLGSDFGATPAERAGVSVTAPVLELAPELSGAVLAGNARALFALDEVD
jgi:aminocarboxymuconate-semialdehyde decarboxylase